VEHDDGRTLLLEAAERLFYAKGIQAVGMDEVRSASGLSLKRVYAYYPSKERLVEAFLERRDVRWRGSLAAYVEAVDDPVERILAVFSWMERWFGEPDFRGCAWINAYGELGATSPVVARLARAHKRAFRDYLGGLVAAAGLPAALTEQLVLLAEGAMTVAGINGGSAPARQAGAAAAVLLEAAAASGGGRPQLPA
jgi:AcrR family transcriptional regulator